MEIKTLSFEENTLKLIDQRKLPVEVSYFYAETYQDIKIAIADMVVRGAPAIGAVAAYGVYLAALEYQDLVEDEFITKILNAKKDLISARATAVNLSWAVNRMKNILLNNKHKPRELLLTLLLKEADLIKEEDIEINKKIGIKGNEIVPDKANILTHCNAGALATVDFGTALGVIREAHYQGKDIHVYADETRPRLQGARLTAFELLKEGIPATLIVDSVAATLIRDRKIDVIIVGADRIAVNGDTANKIGTFMLSVLALTYQIPFYIAAPISTIDFTIDNGEEIEIEERDSREITHPGGRQIAPDGIKVYNPAFDVTPADNITGIITEKGIITNPDQAKIIKLQNG